MCIRDRRYTDRVRSTVGSCFESFQIHQQAVVHPFLNKGHDNHRTFACRKPTKPLERARNLLRLYPTLSTRCKNVRGPVTASRQILNRP